MSNPKSDSGSPAPRMARLQLGEPQILQEDVDAVRVHPVTHKETDTTTVLLRGTTFRREIRIDVPPFVDYVIVQTAGRKRWIVDKDSFARATTPRSNGVVHWAEPIERVRQEPAMELPTELAPELASVAF